MIFLIMLFKYMQGINEKSEDNSCSFEKLVYDPRGRASSKRATGT